MSLELQETTQIEVEHVTGKQDMMRQCPIINL